MYDGNPEKIDFGSSISSMQDACQNMNLAKVNGLSWPPFPEAQWLNRVSNWCAITVIALIPLCTQICRMLVTTENCIFPNHSRLFLFQTASVADKLGEPGKVETN